MRLDQDDKVSSVSILTTADDIESIDITQDTARMLVPSEWQLQIQLQGIWDSNTGMIRISWHGVYLPESHVKEKMQLLQMFCNLIHNVRKNHFADQPCFKILKSWYTKILLNWNGFLSASCKTKVFELPPMPFVPYNYGACHTEVKASVLWDIANEYTVGLLEVGDDCDLILGM